MNNKEPDIQDTVKRGIKLGKIIYHAATKNSTFGKSHADIILMKERLELEEKQKQEKETAIKIIKEIQKKRKEEACQKKLMRRARILKLLHVNINENDSANKKKLSKQLSPIFAFACSTSIASIFLVFKNVYPLANTIEWLSVGLWCVFAVLFILSIKRKKN